MKEKPNLSLYIKDIEKARWVAERIGYRVPRGVRAGEGNISQVINGIASGDIAVVKISDFDNNQILKILGDITNIAENSDNPEAKKFFTELAESVENAFELRM